MKNEERIKETNIDEIRIRKRFCELIMLVIQLVRCSSWSSIGIKLSSFTCLSHGVRVQLLLLSLMMVVVGTLWSWRSRPPSPGSSDINWCSAQLANGRRYCRVLWLLVLLIHVGESVQWITAASSILQILNSRVLQIGLLLLLILKLLEWHARVEGLLLIEHRQVVGQHGCVGVRCGRHGVLGECRGIGAWNEFGTWSHIVLLLLLN